MNFTRLKRILSSVVELGEEPATSLLQNELAELSRERAALSAEQDLRARQAFRRELLQIVHESHFCRYAYRKPRGYPGDFVTQEMIWLSRTNGQSVRYAGDTRRGRLINSVTMNMENAAANEERVYFLRRLVEGSSGGRVASIGCGSCIELWDPSVLARRSDWRYVLVDQDSGALEAARRAVAPSDTAVRTVHENVLKFVLRAEQRLGPCDLVYLFGLLDYFSEANARKIVECLWPVIAPGGELVVTNAHPSNPTRLWMEYVADWFLDYKTESTLLGLADRLPDCQAQVRRDSFGVYQYLRLRRQISTQSRAAG
ncbi:MAG: class I SAM-dependent methyltransferase [Polyangiaceae bacterium]|nr:class I SAM-dependent methyltransferase [Polyangiaceae bacterium]